MTEPLLKENPNRFVILPIEQPSIWDFYKKAQAVYWTAEEIDFEADTDDWKNLTPDEQYYLKQILAFFAASDGIVNENLAENMVSEVQSTEAKFFYGFQIAVENIHCVSKDTKILTKQGSFSIDSLVGKNVEVWNGVEWSKVKVQETGVQKLYRVELSDGSYLDCTEGHKWFIRTGNQLHPELCKKEEIQTKDLTVGDIIHPFNLGVTEGLEELPNAWIQGFHTADGSYTNGYPMLELYGEKKGLLEHFGESLDSSKKNPYRFYLTDKVTKPKFFVPVNYSLNSRLRWLEGVLDGDGTINLNGKKTATSIQYSSINYDYLLEVKELLATLGVKTNLAVAKGATNTLLPDGKGGHKPYETKELYVIYITCADVAHLISLGLAPKRLQLLQDDNLVAKRKLIRVTKVTDLEKEEQTYCFNEPNLHAGTFNGLVTGQSEVYSLLIDTYIKDSEEKLKLFRALEHNPVVQKKAKWALDWIEDATFAERLIAFAAVEGIFFSGSFCAIFWLQNRGVMKSLCTANEFISRDEGLHCDFAVHLHNMLENPLPTEKVREIILSALQIEKEFIRESLPVSLIGMNADLMSEYLEFVTDRLLVDLGCGKTFNTPNPFAWMETIALNTKTNFFEKEVTNYSKTGVGDSNASHAFSTDEDF